MLQKLELDDSVAQLLFDSLKLEGFFPEFTVEHARMIFLRSGLYLYPKGSRVVEQGEQGRDLYIIQKGTLEVVRKIGPVVKRLATLSNGDIFGEMALLRDGVRNANVVVAKDSRIFRLVYDDIQYLLKNNRALGEHLEQIVNERSRPSSSG